MNKITDILDSITDLTTPCGVVFTGYFAMRSRNVLFIGRVKIEDYRKLDYTERETFGLSGSVNGQLVFIEKAFIEKANIAYSFRQGAEPEYIPVHVLPHEVIIGMTSDEAPIIVERIETVMPELNWFFSFSVVSPVFDPKMNNYPAKFNPLGIATGCENTKFLLTRTFGSYKNITGQTFFNVNILSFDFTTPIPLMEAVREVASARLFFCFLADDYVALPSEISFSTPTSQTLEEDGCRLADKTLWLNDNRTYYTNKKKYPFRIHYGAIKDCFTDTWKGWTTFWDNPLNYPMIDLFVEIISNKSVGLNRFLNLCQALEVYSTQHRSEQIKKESATTDKQVTLCKRMKDLFQYHQDVLPQKADISQDIADISQDIADIRNYYTHYDPKLQKRLEDKYSNISAVADKYEDLLHFLLLATTYKEMGIPSGIIKEAMSNIDSRFHAWPEQLIQGTHNPEDVLKCCNP